MFNSNDNKENVTKQNNTINFLSNYYQYSKLNLTKLIKVNSSGVHFPGIALKFTTKG